MSRIITRPDAQNRRFKVGSRAFFEGMPGFEPNDLDEVEFEDEPVLYRDKMQFRKKDGTRCLFKWRRMSADEFVEHALRSDLPMEAGKFLVPEVAEYLGITMDHLKKLGPVFERMDDRHAYERSIFEAYVKNNAFELTEYQKAYSYGLYIKTRQRAK